MGFFVFQCKNCGKWGTREVRKVYKAIYKCVYCNKSGQIKKSTELGLAFSHKGPYESGSLAAKVCQELNKKRWESKNISKEEGF